MKKEIQLDSTLPETHSIIVCPNCGSYNYERVNEHSIVGMNPSFVCKDCGCWFWFDYYSDYNIDSVNGRQTYPNCDCGFTSSCEKCNSYKYPLNYL